MYDMVFEVYAADESWPMLIVPEGTKILFIVYTWPSYRDRLDLGDVELE